jgi:hypothetical protein
MASSPVREVFWRNPTILTKAPKIRRPPAAT